MLVSRVQNPAIFPCPRGQGSGGVTAACKGPPQGRLRHDSDISPLKPPGSVDYQAKEKHQVIDNRLSSARWDLGNGGHQWPDICDKFILHGLGQLLHAQRSPAKGLSGAVPSYAVPCDNTQATTRLRIPAVGRPITSCKFILLPLTCSVRLSK